MIQIRNVPEDVHRKLKAKAALAGMSLSDYLLSEIASLADRPSLQEVLQRIRSRPKQKDGPGGAEIIRQLRGPLP